MLEEFGRNTDGDTVYRARLKNSLGMIVDILNYGATIQKILVPSETRGHVDVCLGYDDMNGYLSPSNPYMGACIGRVCNRICGGKFILGGHSFFLHQNEQNNSLHGGQKGFDKHLWEMVQVLESRVHLSHSSPHGDEGYPARVNVKASIELTDLNELIIQYSALSDRDTPLNLTNHAYFNLGGEDSGEKGLFEHDVAIFAKEYTPVNEQTKIPTGVIQSVGETLFDLRKELNLSKVLHQSEHLYDHNFVLGSEDLKLAARVMHHPSGRGLECWTNQLGLQFYTGNHLGNAPTLQGKSGKPYENYGGFCLEAQNYPDAVNQQNFPSCILGANDKYENRTIYKFIF
uniref:Aldose 1-epimerase n=1 Tax=Caligus rogercresseyi TaxID=217165 RepID=C1BRN3_CALRO|nr:Aldose 1-epimerase [Caligus rogercresseyi]